VKKEQPEIEQRPQAGLLSIMKCASSICHPRGRTISVAILGFSLWCFPSGLVNAMSPRRQQPLAELSIALSFVGRFPRLYSVSEIGLPRSNAMLKPISITLITGIAVCFGLLKGQEPGAKKAATKAVPSAEKSAKADQPKFKAIWEPVNVKEDLQLQSVHFVTPEEGWVAGGRSGMAGGVILHTKDSGANWEVQLGDPESSDRSYAHLQFLSPTLGWAVQSTGVGDHKLMRTDGKQWTAAGTVAQHRTDFKFTSAQVGFVASGTNILRTQDGGQKWQSVYQCKIKAEVNGLTRDVTCDFDQLFFLNPNIGWAISAEVAKGAGAVLAKTTDGGMTWDSWLILPGENPREGALGFTDENHGAVRVSNAKFFYTGDGGKTWTGASGQIDGKPNLEFADSQVGWAIRYRTMLYTVDGGHNWVSRTIMFPGSVEGFSLVSRESGYVVGDHGMVYRYRIVPIEYTSKGMLPAPAMPVKQ